MNGHNLSSVGESLEKYLSDDVLKSKVIFGPEYLIITFPPRYIEEVYEPDGCYVKICLDINRIQLLKVTLVPHVAW